MKITPALGPMSGKLGGIVASHNRGGAYFRRKSIPTNPNTIRQQEMKNAFATLVEWWTETLTQGERDAWNVYGVNVPSTDTLGATIFLTGQNWFIANNSPRLQAGAAVIEAAPVIFDRGNPVTSFQTVNQGTSDSIGVNGTAMSTQLNIAGTASAAGSVLVYLGAPKNPTINFFKGPYQLAAAFAVTASAASAAFTTTIAELLNANGAPTIGQTRPIRVRISYNDGRLSPSFTTMAPVIDDPE